jgi:hypothetical protein
VLREDNPMDIGFQILPWLEFSRNPPKVCLRILEQN